MKKKVYIVHAVDTEGPLYESLNATFIRIKDTFNVDITPSYDNLKKLQNKEINLDGLEEIISKFLDPKLLNYNDSWDKIDTMLQTIMSTDFRKSVPDSFGNGWIYNWFCLDHVGYETNPRHRDMGFHNIRDRYLEYLDKYSSPQDTIQWHFHPMSTYKEAHRCAKSFENSPQLHEIICRMIIERNSFPMAFRAGFQTERPDSNWFLEQWIPFDCSNMAMENTDEFELQKDCKKGRMGDWRRAPHDWSIYNPDIYDYQKEGNCNRYIARFLNINTRIANITEYEVERAFKRADKGLPTLMGVTNHDFRDMKSEVEYILSLIRKVSIKYPDVEFKYSDVISAFQEILFENRKENIDLDVKVYKEEGVYNLDISTKEGRVFGPQPYLAIKTKSGRFIHDNLDFGLDGKSWHYVFDYNTILSNDIDTIAVATNNIYGNQFIKILKECDFKNG